MRATYGAVAAVLVAIGGQIAMAEDGAQMILMPARHRRSGNPARQTCPKAHSWSFLRAIPASQAHSSCALSFLQTRWMVRTRTPRPKT